MPIQFTCPFCGAQTNVADQYAGQTGPCAKCGQPITVPGTPVGPDAYTATPTRTKSTSGVWIVLGILVGVVMVLLVCGGILTALLLPAIQAAREAARRMACMNNMKQIAVALQNYQSQYGQFPPAYVADANGKPMHSWRVLILPYLEQDHVYAQYNFDEPWDSPNNRGATSQTWLNVFKCPSDPSNDGTKTNYVMVVGPRCISDGPTARDMAQIRDGTSKTIMLVEVANSDISWAEPRDLDATTMSYQINDPSGHKCISSNHPGAACVVFVDGRAELLFDDVDQKTLREMIQVDDGTSASDEP